MYEKICENRLIATADLYLTDRKNILTVRSTAQLAKEFRKNFKLNQELYDVKIVLKSLQFAEILVSINGAIDKMRQIWFKSGFFVDVNDALTNYKWWYSIAAAALCQTRAVRWLRQHYK